MLGHTVAPDRCGDRNEQDEPKADAGHCGPLGAAETSGVRLHYQLESGRPARLKTDLAIEDPSVIFRASQTRGLPGFEAEVRFLLRETGRTIGATIGTVTVPGETRDGFCTAGLYVAPGGVLDTYYTDEGFKSLGYCATYLGIVPTRTLGVPASVSVTFTDDDGVLGTVSAVAVEK